MTVVYSILGSIFALWTIGSIVRYRKARNRALNTIEEKCTGCQRCVKRCHRKALSIVDKKVVLNPMRCSACGDCIAVCKFNALVMVNQKDITSVVTH